MVTVERVLPWRRERRTIATTIEPLIERFEGAGRDDQVDVVSRAYKMAAKAHEGQFRQSGEPYIVHPLAVAKIVASLGLDDVSIAAALLHDAVEDTLVETADIERAFGPEIADIVEGVTKLDRLHFDSKQAQQAASFRKMLVAMSKDLRVLIVKLCDRLHNLRTLAAMPSFKQERTALETLEVYAPLAHRLGMEEVKVQLEELSFAALHPKRFAEIEQMVSTRAPERELFLTQVLEDVRSRLAELGIEAQVIGRDKHLYSIYEKMMRKSQAFDEINDLIGLRVIVGSVRDCYAALGSIHATWKPVQGRFKDYVAMPKFNLYQSLHTSVVGPQGKPVEVQIRTWEMHDRAESGVAAHYVYKDIRNGSVDLPWLKRIVDWEKETSDPAEFMSSLKVDLDSDEVFVFTPQGEVVNLPAGSTPIDFAYSIHTDVGHRCVGSRVDGRLVSLSEPLKSGQSVEVFTTKDGDAGPSKDWLNFVSSRRATSKIKQWFMRERRADAITSGRNSLSRAVKREGIVRQVAAENLVERVADELKYVELESLFAAIGEHQVSVDSIIGRIMRHLDGPDDSKEIPSPITQGRTRRDTPGSSGVAVEGLDDVMVRLSRCCTPVPGDQIMGFVTRGRGVSVHQTDCSNAESLAGAQHDRLIDVEWEDEHDAAYFIASLEVKAYDRSHLLRDISEAFSDQHVNIVTCETATAEDRIARLKFDFEIVDPAHLEALQRAIRNVDGVYDVYRVIPGRT